jgi:PAS domain S-box-containing protein
MITDSTSISYFSNPLVLTNIFGTIITGLGGLGACIITWKSILKPLWLKHLKKQKEQDSVLINQSKFFVHIEEMTEKILEISKELKPNGGGSIKDQIKQIANDVKIIMIERDATFYLSKEPMFKTDDKGYYISVNTSLCNLIGATEIELLGLGWLNYISLQDRDRVWEEWENIIESGKEISTYFTIKNPETTEMIPVKCIAIINRSGNSVISIIGSIEKTPKKEYKKLNVA